MKLWIKWLSDGVHGFDVPPCEDRLCLAHDPLDPLVPGAFPIVGTGESPFHTVNDVEPFDEGPVALGPEKNLMLSSNAFFVSR